MMMNAGRLRRALTAQARLMVASGWRQQQSHYLSSKKSIVVSYHVSSMTTYRGANKAPPDFYFGNFDDESNDDDTYVFGGHEGRELRKVTYDVYPDAMPWDDMEEDRDIKTATSSESMTSRVEDEETLRHVKTIGKNPSSGRTILDLDEGNDISIPAHLPRAASRNNAGAAKTMPRHVVLEEPGMAVVSDLEPPATVQKPTSKPAATNFSRYAVLEEPEEPKKTIRKPKEPKKPKTLPRHTVLEEPEEMVTMPVSIRETVVATTAKASTSVVEKPSTEQEKTLLKGAKKMKSLSRYAVLEEPKQMVRKPASSGETLVTTTANAAGVLEKPFIEQEMTPKGTGPSTEDDTFQEQLEKVQKEIDNLHGSPLNVNSTKQLSLALFGEEGRSTSKRVLQTSCNDNDKQTQMARLVLSYRAIKSEMRRAKRTESLLQAKGEVVTATTNPEDEPLLLVDTSGFVFRAYYSLPELKRSDGTPVNAVRGFCSMIFRLVKERLIEGVNRPNGGKGWGPPPPRLILVFDAPGPSFRKELYPEYKANRPSCPVDLQVQFRFIKYAAEAFGIPQMESSNYEADDVIATLTDMASKDGIPTRILSSDKDLMQLITPKHVTPRVHMMDPKSYQRTTYEDVEKKFGVAPGQVGDMLALIGDNSDNIPGVKGIGQVGAKQLLNDYGTLDTLLENLDAVKNPIHKAKLTEGQEAARLSKKLVDLERNVPITLPEYVSSIRDVRMKPLNGERLMEFYERMEFRNLASQLSQQLNFGQVKGASAVKVAKSNRSRWSPKKRAVVPAQGDWSGDVPF